MSTLFFNPAVDGYPAGGIRTPHPSPARVRASFDLSSFPFTAVGSIERNRLLVVHRDTRGHCLPFMAVHREGLRQRSVSWAKTIFSKRLCPRFVYENTQPLSLLLFFIFLFFIYIQMTGVPSKTRMSCYWLVQETQMLLSASRRAASLLSSMWLPKKIPPSYCIAANFLALGNRAELRAEVSSWWILELRKHAGF